MYKNILLSTDGSELARKGVEHGIALAKALSASRNTSFAGHVYPWVCRETLPNAFRKGYREIDSIRVVDVWLQGKDGNLGA